MNEAKSARILTVIPCLNEELYLEKLVKSVIDANVSLAMHIVIADGCSIDHTPAIAQNLTDQFPNVSFLINPKRTQASALNLAVAAYGDSAEYIIRIDAHADYPEDYCETLVAEADATTADSVVVAMRTSGRTWFQKAVAAAQNSVLGNGGSAHRTDSGIGMWVEHGHHALMRTSAFRAVHGYDETFSHNEDAELDARLCRAGYKIWLTGKTSLVYYPRSAPGPLFRQHLKYGYGRARNIMKNRRVPRLRQLAPAAVLPAVLIAFLPFPSASWPCEIWLGFCLGYGLVLAVRTKIPSRAAAGPAAILMHLGWSIGFWKGIVRELWSKF